MALDISLRDNGNNTFDIALSSGSTGNSNFFLFFDGFSLFLLMFFGAVLFL
jgi:hypothetical protein